MTKAKRALDILKAMEINEGDLINLVRFGMEVTAKNGRGRLSKVITAGSFAYTFGRRAWDAFWDTQPPTDYILVVSEAEERIFYFIQQLLFEQTDKTNRRIVEAELLSRLGEVTSMEDYDPFNRSRSAGREIVLSANPDPGQRLTFGGVTCSVTRQFTDAGAITLTDSEGNGFNLSSSGSNRKKSDIPTGTLALSFDNENDREKFVNALRDHFEVSEPYRASIYIQNPWGDFARMKEVPHRSPESVILHEGQSDFILEHIRKFVVNEQKYTDLGIPWHTGILFHGPAGTGKSSLATMLATALDYDTYVISLTSVKDDNTLSEYMSSVRPRSIVLLEDVDVAGAATRDSDEYGGVTKQGLLNVLDGASSTHGVIVIMTTNHIERIQPELLRPGRVDLKMEIGYLNDKQIRQMCQYFLGEVPGNLPFISEDDKITPADLVGVFRDHIEDLSCAVPAVVEFVENKKLEFKELELNANVSSNI